VEVGHSDSWEGGHEGWSRRRDKVGRGITFSTCGLIKAITLFTVAVGGKGRFRMLGLVTEAFRDFRRFLQVCWDSTSN
jgi:hypothetical protein